MATVLPRQESSGEVLGKALGQFASAAADTYLERADEMALKKTIEKLGPNYTPREFLNAVTNTKTHNDVKKKELIDTQLKLAQLEAQESKVKAKTQSELEKREREQRETEALVAEANPNLSQEQIKAKAKDLSPASARSLVVKPEVVTPYKIAQNQAKRFEPEIKHLAEKTIADRSTIPILETAIINNEAYTLPEKAWDTFLDLGGSMWSPLKSKRGQELEAITPISMSSFSQKMGGVMTNRKIELISKKAAGLGKDKNANRLMLYLDYADKQMDIMRNNISNEIIAESEYGLAPADYDKQMRERLKPFQKMIDNDINLLLKDKIPTSPILQPSERNKFFENAPEGQVPVVSPQGTPGYLSEDELNSPEFKGYRRL